MLKETEQLLQQKFFDKGLLYRKRHLFDRARREMTAARGPEARRRVVQRALDGLGVSHLRVMSKDVYQKDIGSEKDNLLVSCYGADLEMTRSGLYVRCLVEDGAGVRSGLRLGDRITAVNGLPTEVSPLIRDSGTGGVKRFDNRGVPVEVETDRGRLVIQPQPDNRVRASQRSLRQLNMGGEPVVFCHIWHFAHPSMLKLLDDGVSMAQSCGGVLILDLRGYGGTVAWLPHMVGSLENYVRGGGKGLVLIDKETRSIKETLAQNIRGRRLMPLVGEKTIGSCLASLFFELPEDTILFMPVEDLSNLADGVKIEGRGVKPDVSVKFDPRTMRGRDTILDQALGLVMGGVHGQNRLRF